MSCQRVQYILSKLSRIPLAALLPFLGFIKGVDPIEDAIKIEECLRVVGLGSLQAMALALSVALCSFEFLLEGSLLVGLWRRFTAQVTTLFTGVMTLVTLYLTLFSPVSDCGCFGDTLKLADWQTFDKNVFFMAITIVYLLTYRKANRPLRDITDSVITASFLLGWGIFVGRGLRHLPLISFRPYKVGVSLRELTMIPEGAPQKEIEYLFICKKNGLREAFNMEELPDSTWTYIGRQGRIIREGYKPPVMDFAIYAGGSSQQAAEREVT